MASLKVETENQQILYDFVSRRQLQFSLLHKTCFGSVAVYFASQGL